MKVKKALYVQKYISKFSGPDLTELNKAFEEGFKITQSFEYDNGYIFILFKD